ncbi:MAG: MGMT family protein [Bacteroidales bacterium]|nr:MGMT family protein [Bacteroidales bacterium]
MKQPTIETLRGEVYDIVRQIPRGRVLTYGRIAELCGWSNHSRLVGRIMRTAPDAVLPCHRVVNASGCLAPHYPAQASLLEKEGVRLTPSGKVPLREYLWEL